MVSFSTLVLLCILSGLATAAAAWTTGGVPGVASLSRQRRVQDSYNDRKACCYLDGRRYGPATAFFSSTRLHCSSQQQDGGGAALDGMGLNELQTLLREAVKAENYKEAARLRDVIAEKLSASSSSGTPPSRSEDGAPEAAGSTDKRRFRRLSWAGLGTAPWLVQRLEALGYNLPTTIQINAFESINAMLLDQRSGSGGGGSGGGTLEELVSESEQVSAGDGEDGNMAVIVSGSTGSGKTLAYAVPLLSTLSESLFRRQRIRVKAEEDVSDAADDLLSRVAVTTSPEVRGRGRNQVGGGGARTASMGKSGSDVRSPLALIVVPTRELGVQTAMNIYELVGGSTKRTATDFVAGSKTNMFKYKGPRGVKIGCILDSVEAESGLKLQTDIAITTPKYLTRLLDENDVDPSKLRVIVFDEADLALEATRSQDMKRLFHLDNTDEEDDDVDDEPWLRHKSRLTYMVGASVTEALKDAEGAIAKDGSILPKGRTYLATATSFSPVTFDDDGYDGASGSASINKTSLKQLRLQLDPGLVHERVVAPNSTGLLCLCRMLRQELREYSESIANNATTTKIQRPRVVIFFPNEKEASQSMSKLRDAMWGDYRLSVLLPNTGVNPLSIMEDFKLNKTSVLLATPNSVRGLDFADLTHVYTLYLPAQDPREYVHLAGRVGRIGQLGSVSGKGGRVTSILRPSEADEMEDMAKKLNFDFVDIEFARAGFDLAPAKEDEEGWVLDEEGNTGVEDMRRYLEDMITLVGDDEDDEEGEGGSDDDKPSPKNSGCDI